jgi:hypothetical protein
MSAKSASVRKLAASLEASLTRSKRRKQVPQGAVKVSSESGIQTRSSGASTLRS